MVEELADCIAKTNISNNLKKNGWKVLSDASLFNCTKFELITTIRMLENNWSNKIEQYDNSIHYAEQRIERMKCCANCKYSEEDSKTISVCDKCFEMCYWELKE